MNLFSKIGSLFKEKPSDSIMDDNVAIAAEDNNPYVSAAVLGARNAYDTLHMLMGPLIKGKKSSLKQIDKWLNDWLDRLKQIEEMYAELLGKINDLGADFTGTFTLDFAKEAWEIVQDTPILRRYMGEANYWALYDAMGILATQTGSLAGDLLSGVKATIKQTILALISMTDGLLCLESYLGMIQQYWGALYFKITPLPLLDSIVPNVTCAYWYKLPIPSKSNGTVHQIDLNNNPPGRGFTPLPLPVPDPKMVVRQASYIGKFDYQNPDTWYLDGTPYYLPNTMYMLERALQYWGSSYTNEYLPAINAFYPRRSYGEGSAKPLRVGHTFAQLDTDKMSLNGTNVEVSDGDSDKPSVSEIFAPIFTETFVALMDQWQQLYETAYNMLLNYILEGFQAYGVEPSTITQFWLLQMDVNNVHPSGKNYDRWRLDSGFADIVENQMTAIWRQMVVEFENNNVLEPTDNAYEKMYDAIMSAFNEAAHVISGKDGSLNDDEVYMAAPSFNPVSGVNDDWNRNLGVPFVAYKVNKKSGQVIQTSSGGQTVAEGDSVDVAYSTDGIGFVMLPSNDSTDYQVRNRSIEFNCVAGYIITKMTNVTAGLNVATPVKDTPAKDDQGNDTREPMTVGYQGGDNVNDDAILMEQYAALDAATAQPKELGPVSESLYKHKSAQLNLAKVLVKNESVYLGNIFFPDGKVPASAEEAQAPTTFVTYYRSFNESATSVNEELADIIGYSIDHGRETKFPCFGVYGDLLSMQSWHYKEMPYLEFAAKYAKVKSGSSLYYERANPGHILFYHSSYVSQTRSMQMAIVHEALESTTKSYGSNDSYTFYVFPCESISVSKLSGSPSLGSFLSVDAVSPSGDEYHYITMRNPIPKCAKYVDPEKWSLMDIIHELYLLAYNLAGLCGDNGERLKNLQDDLSEFHISTPQFIGQLPENNGQYSPFRFEIFKDYADKIEKFVNSVYDFRAKIIAATEAL